ncbi:MAG TPA: aspartate kinase [Candidatus Limnocylindrales bacterium]|nr:aspartate kinase [Candidatus Limnocylindrales bacterium]
MALIVQKFGGTSVGNIERIKKVADRIIETKKQGHDVIVVVSAMSGETDKLLNMAYQITDTPDGRELDMLLATGEQVSIALLAMALQAKGQDARSFTGQQVRIITDSAHTKARIREIDSERIFRELNQGKVVVVAGFQGIDENGEITTLGRGGSDTTGVAIAAAIGADICEIYTDVDGVYTTDPHIVPEARKLSRISYDEMLEMASLGAKVLQIRSVAFAKKYNVPIHVRSSFKKEEGTLVIQEDSSMEDIVVTGIAHTKNEVKITIKGIPDRPGIAAKLFEAIARDNINVDMIIQNTSDNGLADISFTISKEDGKKALKLTEEIGKELGATKVLFDPNIAKVSAIGVGMRNHVGVAAKVFQALAKEGINILMISTSEIRISCVVEAKYGEQAVRALHDAFDLANKKAS